MATRGGSIPSWGTIIFAKRKKFARDNIEIKPWFRKQIIENASNSHERLRRLLRTDPEGKNLFHCFMLAYVLLLQIVYIIYRG